MGETASKYPEHDKLRAHKAEAETVGRFYDWLRHSGYHLAEWRRFEGCRDDRLSEVHIRPDQLIGDFLGISPQKLEDEKRAMLEELRGASRRPGNLDGHETADVAAGVEDAP